MASTSLLFLGVDSVTPVAGDDTISFVINRHILVDCGWCAALRLLDHGLAPTELKYLFFTHMHHDHYLGLPQILFHRWMLNRRSREVGPLTIVGPAEDLALVVQLAKDFLQSERFGHQPELELRPLEPGEGLETDEFKLTTCSTIHPVQGLCYRFFDKVSGATVGFTGDTAYHPPIAEHLKGVDLMIHEASHGANSMRDQPNQSGHSGAPDAAEIAAMAEARRLALVHSVPKNREAAVAIAKEVFPNTFWPQVGETVEVEAG